MSLRSRRSTALALITLATFTDIVAYSVAVPVLPDLSRRLGASATVVGLLFASFGVTLLAVSVPMGAVSDRVGRKPPLVGGLSALAVATLLFAFAGGLPALFVARLVQGAADAVTWVVGFALLADLYGPQERGRATGIVMSGTSFAFMIGPSFGGWLYEIGGMRLPFVCVAAMAACAAAAFAWLQLPGEHADRDRVPFRIVLRTPAVAACTAAVAMASATISMLEPVMALHLEGDLGIGPARLGVLFGIAAVAMAALNPIYGRLADRFGARRLTMIGLLLAGTMLPALGRMWSFESGVVLYTLQAATVALVITPSLAYMAEATSDAGIESYGVSYGLYNFAWGAGLLGGPALGGFVYERLGFTNLLTAWAPATVVAMVVLASAESKGRRARS
ncbi:MAG: MFS transporter [Betaproteobacteria bacterium]